MTNKCTIILQIITLLHVSTGQNMMKEDWVSSKGKSFAEYVIWYARKGSGWRELEELYNEPNIKGGKTIPLQAWAGPESSRRLKLPDFRDNQHKKVVRLSAVGTGHLYPQEIFLVLITVRDW